MPAPLHSAHLARPVPGKGKAIMVEASGTVFLVDVDNTLLNNDLFQHALKRHIQARFGPAARDRYWAIQDGLFHSLGYRDYLGAFQQMRAEFGDQPEVLWLSAFVLTFPYESLLFPGALDVLGRLQALGRTVLLTDGDAVFQPLKLQRSGLLDIVGEPQAMIAVHKEQALAEVERRFPAAHYVLIDDKLRLLTAVKKAWGDRVTTVFPRQGQFAFDAAVLADNPPADITIPQIGDLMDPVIMARLTPAG